MSEKQILIRDILGGLCITATELFLFNAVILLTSLPEPTVVFYNSIFLCIMSLFVFRIAHKTKSTLFQTTIKYIIFCFVYAFTLPQVYIYTKDFLSIYEFDKNIILLAANAIVYIFYSYPFKRFFVFK
jgi:hypothetical protein